MTRPSHSRKRSFRIALASAEMTQRAFAEQCGVTSSHISQVLNGVRESATLTEKIDAFIEANAPNGAAA